MKTVFVLLIIISILVVLSTQVQSLSNEQACSILQDRFGRRGLPCYGEFGEGRLVANYEKETCSNIDQYEDIANLKFLSNFVKSESLSSLDKSSLTRKYSASYSGYEPIECLYSNSQIYLDFYSSGGCGIIRFSIPMSNKPVEQTIKQEVLENYNGTYHPEIYPLGWHTVNNRVRIATNNVIIEFSPSFYAC